MLDCNLYKHKLTISEKIVYNQMYSGLQDCLDSIDVNNINSVSYERIMDAILMDHPTMFHFNSGSVFNYGGHCCFKPRYIIPKKQYQEYISKCNTAINGIVSQIRCNDIWKTLLALHSKLISTLQYREIGNDSHTIIGPLLNHTGVCDGIAKTVKTICDFLRIPCVVIDGKTQSHQTLIGSHSWNAIYIEHMWYCFDFTFDLTLQQNNPCKSIIRLDYFCILPSEMAKDHFDWSLSFNDGVLKKDYFSQNGLNVRNKKDIINNLFRRNNNDIACKINTNWIDFEISKVMDYLVDSYMNAHKSGCRYTYTYNEIQRVLYVHFE